MFSSTAASGISNFTPGFAVMLTFPYIKEARMAKMLLALTFVNLSDKGKECRNRVSNIEFDNGKSNSVSQIVNS